MRHVTRLTSSTRCRSIQAEHASQRCCNQDLEAASFSESKDGHTARVSALPLSDASGIAAAVHSHTMGRVGGSQASDSILDSSTSVLDHSVLHSRAQAAASRQQPRRVDRGGQYSATVIESVSIPGLAVFTAFYDGRVRALFADRCPHPTSSTICQKHVQAPAPAHAHPNLKQANPIGTGAHTLTPFTPQVHSRGGRERRDVQYNVA